MADEPDDQEADPRTRTLEGSSPASIPHSGENEPEEDAIDGEFRVLRDQIARLVRREMLVVREEIRSEIHIGPLPHERTLEAYERIVPGAAKMIFANFEGQGKHRRNIETFAMKWGTIRAFAGLACGLIVTLLFLWASYLLIKDDHDVAGTILGAVDLVGLIAVFVHGSNVVRDERVKKAEIMSGREPADA